MSRIAFLGKSEAQRNNLPTAVRAIFEWASDQLEEAPLVPPNDPSRGCETKALEGPDKLFRIAIRPLANDPGYRAIYAIVGDQSIVFIRTARRDASTYPGLRRAIRLLHTPP